MRQARLLINLPFRLETETGIKTQRVSLRAERQPAQIVGVQPARFGAAHVNRT